jgi:hypothetical protein
LWETEQKLWLGLGSLDEAKTTGVVVLLGCIAVISIPLLDPGGKT